MKDKIILVIFLVVCFFRTYQLSNPKTPDALCLITGLFVPSFGLSSAYYDIIESDEPDDIDSKYATFKRRGKPLSTTPKPEEWRLRGNFRVQCVTETGILPNKVVKFMSRPHKFKTADKELKNWVLCVLNKMDIMTNEGVYKMDVALSKIPKREKQLAEEMIDMCLPKKRIKPYEIAWRYIKCHSKFLKGNFTDISIF